MISAGKTGIVGGGPSTATGLPMPGWSRAEGPPLGTPRSEPRDAWGLT